MTEGGESGVEGGVIFCTGRAGEAEERPRGKTIWTLNPEERLRSGRASRKTATGHHSSSEVTQILSGL